MKQETKEQLKSWLIVIMIFALAALFSIKVSAKNYIEIPKSITEIKKDNRNRLLCTVLSIGLDAAGDAYLDKGDKKTGHILNALSVGSTLLVFPICNMNKYDIVNYGVEYISFRFSIFDYVYNSCRDLQLNYSGTTSFYDDQLSKLPGHAKTSIKTVTLVFSLGWNSQQFNTKKYIKK